MMNPWMMYSLTQYVICIFPYWNEPLLQWLLLTAFMNIRYWLLSLDFSLSLFRMMLIPSLHFNTFITFIIISQLTTTDKSLYQFSLFLFRTDDHSHIGFPVKYNITIFHSFYLVLMIAFRNISFARLNISFVSLAWQSSALAETKNTTP